MKTIVAISDTHGNRAAYREIAGVLAECDYIFHLGDTSSDGNALKAEYPGKTRVLNGNCDIASVGENEICERIEGVNVFACHGDRYSVKRTLGKLVRRAEELGCGLALYGHTHAAAEDSINGVLAVNPGTLSRYSEKSYAYIVINGEKVVSKIVRIG